MNIGIISIIVLAIGIYKLVGMYKNRECEEENLGLKIFGYYFLGSFRFNFNWIPIKQNYDPTDILYEVKYNREKNDDKYIVKRRMLDEPSNQEWFIDESNVDAGYFLEKINIIKDVKAESGYEQYAIALVEKNTGYGILDRRSVYIDGNNEKKELENSDFPVSGQWVKHCGVTEILEDTQHRVNLYKNEGIDYIFGY